RWPRDWSSDVCSSDLFVGDPRDSANVERLERYNQEHGIWDCTRCYFCNERCPKGVDPRDAIAKLGAESIRLGIDRDMGAKHAKRSEERRVGKECRWRG